MAVLPTLTSVLENHDCCCDGCPLPTITTVDPPSGNSDGGTVVTITGTNFENAVVILGGIPQTVDSETATEIVFTTTPHAAGSVTLSVGTDCGITNLPNAFEYTADALLQENGDYILQESGDLILLET